MKNVKQRIDEDTQFGCQFLRYQSEMEEKVLGEFIGPASKLIVESALEGETYTAEKIRIYSRINSICFNEFNQIKLAMTGVDVIFDEYDISTMFISSVN